MFASVVLGGRYGVEEEVRTPQPLDVRDDEEEDGAVKREDDEEEEWKDDDDREEEMELDRPLLLKLPPLEPRAHPVCGTISTRQRNNAGKLQSRVFMTSGSARGNRGGDEDSGYDRGGGGDKAGGAVLVDRDFLREIHAGQDQFLSKDCAADQYDA